MIVVKELYNLCICLGTGGVGWVSGEGGGGGGGGGISFLECLTPHLGSGVHEFSLICSQSGSLTSPACILLIYCHLNSVHI